MADYRGDRKIEVSVGQMSGYAAYLECASGERRCHRSRITRGAIGDNPSLYRRSNFLVPQGMLPFSPSHHVKKRGGDAPPPLQKHSYLLKYRSNCRTGTDGGTDCGTGRVVAQHTRLIRAESARTGRGVYSRGVGFKGLERRSGCASARRTNRRQEIPRLRAQRQNRVDQASVSSGRNATSRAAECCEVSPKTLSPRGGVGDLSRGDGANGTNRRRLVSRNAGAKQVRNRDRRDNQDDRYDDQQFNKRKPFVILVERHCSPSQA